jgi:ribosome biogenesis GTPase A
LGAWGDIGPYQGKEGHITTLNKMDPRDQFETMVTKWKKYFAKIRNVIFFNMQRMALCVKINGGQFSKNSRRYFITI